MKSRKPPPYISTTDLARMLGYTGPHAVTMARREAREAGILIKWPGRARKLAIPIDRFRQTHHDLWDRYCAEESMFEEFEDPCDHPEPMDLGAGLLWCPRCGGLRKPHHRWQQPTRGAR